LQTGVCTNCVKTSSEAKKTGRLPLISLEYGGAVQIGRKYRFEIIRAAAIHRFYINPAGPKCHPNTNSMKWWKILKAHYLKKKY
jgi:hypothetical protein